MGDLLMAFEDVNSIWVTEKLDTVVHNDPFVSLRPDAAKGLEFALDHLAKEVGAALDTQVAELRKEEPKERMNVKPGDYWTCALPDCPECAKLNQPAPLGQDDDARENPTLKQRLKSPEFLKAYAKECCDEADDLHTKLAAAEAKHPMTLARVEEIRGKFTREHWPEVNELGDIARTALEEVEKLQAGKIKALRAQIAKMREVVEQQERSTDVCNSILAAFDGLEKNPNLHTACKQGDLGK